MTFNQYLIKVYTEVQKHPEYRFGQALFNVLHDTNFRVAVTIAPFSDIDPFYAEDETDPRIERFLDYVQSHWDE